MRVGSDEFWLLIGFRPLRLVSEDPYYCGLSARVPKFECAVVPKKKSNKSQNVVPVPKRMSVAYLQHPLLLTAPGNGFHYPVKQLQHQPPPPPQKFIKQKQAIVPRKNYQQMMWHARSMESGLGKTLEKTKATKSYPLTTEQQTLQIIRRNLIPTTSDWTSRNSEISQDIMSDRGRASGTRRDWSICFICARMNEHALIDVFEHTQAI